MSKRILVSGSHGFIGEALVEALSQRGDTVVRLVRSNPRDGEVLWNSQTGAVDAGGVEGFDAVVHLGGVSIGEKRWSEAERGRIWDSRVNTTDLLSQLLARSIDRPKVFVVASAIGFYGNRGDEMLDEASSKGEGFLATVVENWEQAAAPARDAGIRTVHIRTGIVLGADGGLLKRLGPVYRGALGGRLGNGDQYMSWVSLRDEVRAILFAIDNERISGPVVVCSPNPVTNLEFTKVYGRALRRPTFVPVWPWMLNFAFGRQLTDEVLLVSQRGVPKALTKAGFHFEDQELQPVLNEIAQQQLYGKKDKATETGDGTENKRRKTKKGHNA